MRNGLWIIVLLLLAPGNALAAGSAWIDDGGFARFSADPGDANSLNVSAIVATSGSATVVFSDSGATIDSTDCSGTGTNTVTCSGPLAGWNANLDDMNDAASVSGNLEGGLFGGDGDDILNGSETNELQEFVDGQGGNDQVFGRGGDDFVVGEAGADFVDGGAGSDTVGDAGGEGSDVLTGGAGFDTALYTDAESPANDQFTVDLLGGFGGRTNFLAETDALSSFEDVDTAGLGTNSAADTVTGSNGSNVMLTGDGVDIVNPAGGADTVIAGAGSDAIEARDGANDRIDCDAGVDNLQADQFDEFEECEVVGITSTAAANTDSAPPGCTVVGVRSKLRRRAFLRGVTPDVNCNEPATLELELLAQAGLLARVGDVVLAERTTPAGTDVRLKPTRRLARRLPRRKGFRVQLVVDARDQFGNRSIVRQTIRVKKARKKRRPR